MMFGDTKILCPHGRSIMLIIDSGAVRRAEPCDICDRIAALALYQVACEAWGLVGRLAARDIVVYELVKAVWNEPARPPDRRFLAMLHITRHRG